MPMTAAALRHEAIGTLLARRAGKNPDANAIARATRGIWPEVAARLAPVIGARGVDVLFGRALHHTRTAFPWLQMAGDHGSGVAALDSLRTCLAGQETTAAADASHALLVNFTGLLATLIGDSLTDQLLGPVWAPPLTASEQETGS
jgi:hypothetical protein